MSAGLVFFNFGGACAARLFVALHSLRQYYDGPVTVFLAQQDAYCRIVEADVRHFADVCWFDIHTPARRHIKCVLKPTLFELSPYEHTLMVDADVLFQASPEPLFSDVEKYGLVVTKFSTWHTDGHRMRHRIQRFKPHLTDDEWRIAASEDPKRGKIPAINIGVVGMSKSHASFASTRQRWEQLTMAAANTHMADEHALQVLFPLVSSVAVESMWNESCVFPARDFDDAKIIHYHGHKESEPTRPSSRRWLRAFERMARSGRVCRLMEYVCWAGESLLNNIKRAGVLSNPDTEFAI